MKAVEAVSCGGEKTVVTHFAVAALSERWKLLRVQVRGRRPRLQKREPSHFREDVLLDTRRGEIYHGET